MFAKKHRFMFALLLLWGGLSWLAAALPVQAHSTDIVGPYTIVTGWVDEPPIVGERNAILLIISETASGEPVVGAEGGLTAQVLYGQASYRANLNPTTIPGEYTLELIPTVRGQFDVKLTGTIGETAVDMVVKPEEVFAAARLQFPEALPDTLDHEKQIGVLQEQLQQVRFAAIAGISLAIVGIVMGSVSLFRKK